MNEAIHHSHKRKRAQQNNLKTNSNLQPFPHPKKSYRTLDNLTSAAGVAAPLFTIPQIVEILISKSAQGVSIITWLSFIIFASIWLTYGIIHKEKPIIISNICWIIADIAVVILAVIF